MRETIAVHLSCINVCNTEKVSVLLQMYGNATPCDHSHEQYAGQ